MFGIATGSLTFSVIMLLGSILDSISLIKDGQIKIEITTPTIVFALILSIFVGCLAQLGLESAIKKYTKKIK